MVSCSPVFPVIKRKGDPKPVLDTNFEMTAKLQILLFIIHPCDPTDVICYLIWPCDIAVCITYLISHSYSLSYNTVIKGYFRLGV